MQSSVDNMDKSPHFFLCHIFVATLQTSKRWSNIQVVGEQAPGEFWGLEMPLTPGMLQEMGPKWLTEALHRSKALPLDNSVASWTKYLKDWQVEKSMLIYNIVKKMLVFYIFLLLKELQLYDCCVKKSGESW